jgi:2-polyprenyl-3-methyl-5-hydroxy-6-metoxy-1,4-benzoquinol methylase
VISVDYADTYDPDADFDRHYTLATGSRIRERLRPGDRVLELGCATGLMTSVIAAGDVDVLAIDRSVAYLERARARGLPRVRFELADLDDLPATGRHDHVLATNVMHELADPVSFLEDCRERLTPTGQLHLTLQNPHSIHRLCALELGLIENLGEVSARGRHWGTSRLWSAEEIERLAGLAGLATVACEGVMLKPLPNALLAELPAEVIEGFVRVGHHFPAHCAMNYLVLDRV